MSLVTSPLRRIGRRLRLFDDLSQVVRALPLIDHARELGLVAARLAGHQHRLATQLDQATLERRAGLEAGRQRAREEQERFIADFDSLYHARLLPTAWKLGVFTRTSFDGEFEDWTLMISATDWYNRSIASKKDLVATLWAAYEGVRVQAGGDPDAGSLTIVDNDENKVAECSAEGLRILR